QWGHNVIAAIPGGDSAAQSLAVQPNETNPKVAGRFVGNLVSAAAAGIEAGFGVVDVTGGAAACGTDVLCLAGAPAIALGATEILHSEATIGVASEEGGKL